MLMSQNVKPCIDVIAAYSFLTGINRSLWGVCIFWKIVAVIDMNFLGGSI